MRILHTSDWHLGRTLHGVDLLEHQTGNHDSAIRLGFAAGLMRDGVHLRARVADVGRPVLLADEHGPVVVHALPYLDPDTVRRALADDDAPDGLLPRSHEAVLAAAMRRVRADLAGRAVASGSRPRSVLMAHAFVVGGLASESERDIRVGGVDAAPAHPDVPLGLRGQAAHHER